LKVDEDAESEDYDVKEITGPIPKSTRKRRARHMREPLEDIFVRRSRRLNPGLHGFRIIGTPKLLKLILPSSLLWTPAMSSQLLLLDSHHSVVA
jgi:hypothetical protein